MARSLDLGTVIGRYRVASQLGAGGMGEVYLARDESLDRPVALKILPPDLVRNDERVRRFVQEAKSASSLNHPHIVAIYEIGEAEIGGDPSTGAGRAERLHYIAMELVSGHTLKTLIHQEKTDLRLLVRYLAQAADGLAKAHAAGIVHRDLKPENIMVTSDGFAKVVDFGLAKLTEIAGDGSLVREPDLSPANAPTALGRATGVGVVLGTVGYMSPEQVQGKTIDHRSDIFSLGCVLYEAATRQRPFQADSDVETLHKILKDPPAPIDDLNPNVPADLRRVIRRCLAKSPDRRLQSMKDLALDLAEIDETYDTLSASTGSGTSSSALGVPAVSSRSRLLTVAALVIGLAGVGFGAWQWLQGRGAPPPAPRANLEVTTLARITDMTTAMMSADGRFLAYTINQAGRYNLIVRQMATSQDLVVMPPQESPIGVVAVAPDSSYVYFTSRSAPGSRDWLHRVPAVGGPPRRILERAYEIALSADGSRMVASVDPADRRSGETSLVLANADGTDARTLASVKDGFLYAPAWSPDGRHVAASVFRPGDSAERLTAFAVSDGSEQAIGNREWSIYSIVWAADGRSLVMSASEGLGQGNPFQLWEVSWPDGAARRITSDSNSYNRPVALSSDGQAITTALVRADRSLYSAPADHPDRATRLPGEADSRWLTALPDGRILYRTDTRGQGALWTMAPDGTRRQRITPDRLRVSVGVVAALADVVVFGTMENMAESMRWWRTDSNGSGLAEVPAFGADVSVTSLSPDGLDMYYVKRDGAAFRSLPEIWRRRVDGGDEHQVGDSRKAGPPIFSPDGRLLYRGPPEDPVAANGPPAASHSYEIADAASGRVIRTLSVPRDLTIRWWAPASDALLGVRRVDGTANIWRQPIDGTPATQLTRFGPDQFSGQFAYTADGSQLLFFRSERAPGEVLQFRNWR
jgi:eukaryotic-like serine/threonine-protein kinase